MLVPAGTPWNEWFGWDFWLRDECVLQRTWCVMTMTRTAATQPTDKLHTIPCWLWPARWGHRQIPYCSIQTPNESWIAGWLPLAREEAEQRGGRRTRARYWWGQCCAGATAGAHLQSKEVVVCIRASHRMRQAIESR